MIGRTRGGRKVSLGEHLLDGGGSDLGGNHGCMDSLSGQGVYLPCCVTDDQKVVSVGLADSPDSDRGDLGLLPPVGVLPQCVADVRVLLDKLLFEGRDREGGRTSTRDDIGAEVNVIAGVAEDCRVSREHLLVVHDHSVRRSLPLPRVVVEILVRAVACGLVALLQHSQSLGQVRVGTVAHKQQPTTKLFPTRAWHTPHPVLQVHVIDLNLSLLLQLSPRLLRRASEEFVSIDPLACPSPDALLSSAVGRAIAVDTLIAEGRHETTTRHGVYGAGFEHLVGDPHLLKNIDSRGAPGVAAQLHPRKALTLQQRDLLPLLRHVESRCTPSWSCSDNDSIIHTIRSLCTLVGPVLAHATNASGQQPVDGDEGHDDSQEVHEEGRSTGSMIVHSCSTENQCTAYIGPHHLPPKVLSEGLKKV
eukprot:Hpha_TRINITY_DN11826_c0_g1::TRINITY_DN11826_c0_g1_i2::g.2017::m.2017